MHPAMDRETPQNQGAPFRQHPGFRAALLDYCREMSQRAPPDWPVFKLLDQFNRYMIGFLLVHDHVEWLLHDGPPATLSALQARNALRPRQTVTIVATLKAARLIRSTPLAEDRRVQVLEPLMRLTEEIARSPVAFLRAVDRLQGSGFAVDIANDERRQMRLIHGSAATVLRGGPVLPFPRILHFATRDSGYLILTAVMAAHYTQREGAPMPSLSHRELAMNAQVSPSHVLNLLRHGTASGWFRTDRGGAIVGVDAALTEEFEQWAIWQMGHFQEIAATIALQ